MGRITPPFRQLYRRVVARLRRYYRPLLREEKHKRALDTLIREVWGQEHAAMGGLGEITILDSMNLAANIHNKAEIEELKRRVAEIETRLRDAERGGSAG
ncbi:MAG: hypothetical protein RMJ28_05725 [Nitrososphaerota archaeon]|nr:hypothetical protein [Candidatus Calditenuaceae archaeon]MDW8073713.1 hypothetical protein [Nitrososphaerota archaeon]